MDLETRLSTLEHFVQVTKNKLEVIETKIFGKSRSNEDGTCLLNRIRFIEEKLQLDIKPDSPLITRFRNYLLCVW